MSKGKTLIDRVVNRAVEDAEIKKQIEDLKRQRSEALENLVGETRRILGVSNEEPEAAADDDDDYIERERNVAEDIAYILPFYGDDDDVRLDWDDDETEEWDE